LKNSIKSLITFFLFSISPLSAAILAGPITNSANNHIYYLLTTSSWTASEAEAVGLGGHLVTINDLAEHNWVYNTFSRFGGVGRHLWIGLYRTGYWGPFPWVSGEGQQFTRWAPGEPNNCEGIENRGIIFGPTDRYVGPPGFWNDINDSGFGGSGGGELAPNGVVEVELPTAVDQIPDANAAPEKSSSSIATDEGAGQTVASLSLQITPNLTATPPAVEVCWNSTPNKFYQIEYRSELTTNLWTPLREPVQSEGAKTCVSDEVMNKASRFYRVLLLP